MKVLTKIWGFDYSENFCKNKFQQNGILNDRVGQYLLNNFFNITQREL